MGDGVIAVIVIAGILQFITLIVFFVMASNVGKIKDYVASKDHRTLAAEYTDKGNEERAIGNDEKAIEYYQRAQYRYELMKIGCGFEYNLSAIDEKIQELSTEIEKLWQS